MHTLLLLALASASAPAPPVPPAAAASSSASVVLPGLALLALAVAAFLVSRRNRPAAQRRLLQVVETASIGPRRSLVVARVGGEALVLGVSEAGIALLATRPAAELAPLADDVGAAGDRSFLDALRTAQRGGGAPPSPPSPPAPPSPTWESAEVEELRRKLQAASAPATPFASGSRR